MESTSPVFIGGAGRSGTTLVVDILGLHPNLSPVYETDFVVQIARVLFGGQALPLQQVRSAVNDCMDQWTRPLPIRPHHKREYEQYHHGPHHILFDRPFAMQKTAELLEEIGAGHPTADSFRRFVMALFDEHARRDGKPRWINKTPSYVLAMPLLLHIFPDMRIIHCIRDGRDTACSVVTRTWGPRDINEAAVWWVNRVRPAVEFGRQYPDRYREVRFEDLISQPQKTLGDMLAWLGETADASEIVRRYQDGQIRLDPSRIGDWKRLFNDEDRAAFELVAGEMLAHFGYQ